MEVFWLLQVRILFCTLLGFAFSACAITSTPPSPEIVPGVYIQSGFEFYRWNEGLTVMIWHDGLKTSSCESSTRQRNFAMQCFAVSEDDQRFDWNLETRDGETAKFSIDGQLFDLTNGNLFVIKNSAEGPEVTQLCHDLSKVMPNAEEVVEFGLSEPIVRDFIQSQGQITGCISSYYVSDEIPTEVDVEAAREALINFFSYLNAGEYIRAAQMYGGSYIVMQDHNPEIDPGDHAALFRNACLINGAQCLEVRQTTLWDQPSPTEFQFVVQFTNEDGSLFTRGPCCGDNSIHASLQSEFIYTVRRECTGRYLVMKIPVYLP